MSEWLGAVGAGIGGVILGAVSTLFLTLFEPFQRAIRRWWEQRNPILPITVHVERRLEVIWAGGPQAWVSHSFYLPHSRPLGAAPGSLGEWQSWVEGMGGCDEGETLILVTIVCDSPATVVVRPPVVRTTVTEVDSDASSIIRPAAGGADLTPEAFEVQLGFGTVELASSGEFSYDKPLSWSMKQGDAHQFLIRARADSPGVYSWTAEVPLIVAGKDQSIRVDNRGQPFRTAMLEPRNPTSLWLGDHWEDANAIGG